MTDTDVLRRVHARAIWDAAVEAAQPARLLPEVVAALDLASAPRLLVVGGGKAGATMSAALEAALADRLDRVEGVVNVPADCVRPLQRIVLHAARPAGSNHPTAEGVAGSERMLRLLELAGPDDVAVGLLSGGGSALLPYPAPGVALEDKQTVTKLLHACGATIDEMNCVRKHLSALKGGGMARAFRGRRMVSLIISDVVGDPLDVIASGPTAIDPTTFADAVAVLKRHDVWTNVPANARHHLEAGEAPETLKELPANVENRVVGSNAISLAAARTRAEALGYRVLSLGSFVEGETRPVAVVSAGIARSIRAHGVPLAPPACVLLGGETTVTLGPSAGKGGRNQEFALAVAHKLGEAGMANVVVLSGGTDGEDGPTDAAGAILGAGEIAEARRLGLDVEAALVRHDAYPLLDAVGGLIRTGPTGTNVTDVRVLLIG